MLWLYLLFKISSFFNYVSSRTFSSVFRVFTSSYVIKIIFFIVMISLTSFSTLIDVLYVIFVVIIAVLEGFLQRFMLILFFRSLY